MESVARFLTDRALQLGADTDRDLFARSAFNRFYYAAFLGLKSQLEGTFPGWPRTHKGVPEFLRGSVAKELKKGIQTASKAGDGELVTLCHRAQSATLELASLMEQGYGARVIADYHPESLIRFLGPDDFELEAIPTNVARTWPPKAHALARSLVAAWRQINA